MNTTINNAMINTASFTGKAARWVVDAGTKVWGYAGVAGKAVWSGIKWTKDLIGLNVHTAIVGTVAAVATGVVAGVTGATVLSATAMVGTYAGVVAIPLMALYVVLARMLGHKLSYFEIFGAINVATLLPFAAVYGGLVLAWAVAYASHLVTWAWFQVAVMFVL